MVSNFDGYQFQYAPDWALNAGYHHDFAQGERFWRLAVNTRYEDSFYADFSHTPGGCQAPYIKTDASLTYTAAHGGWTCPPSRRAPPRFSSHPGPSACASRGLDDAVGVMCA